MLAIILFLITSVVTADDTCTLRKSLFKDLDVDKYVGTWYSLYDSPDFGESYSCFTDTFSKTNDVQLHVNSSIINKKDGKHLFEGTVAVSHGNILNFTYPTNEKWSAAYHILALDYDRYAIIEGCPSAVQPVHFIAFRDKNPDNSTLDAVNKTLPELGLSLGKFVHDCRYPQEM